jgi:hypothetical protein
MNLLDHGVADALGSLGAITPATVNREYRAHFGVPRSKATAPPKGSAGAARHPAATNE